MAGLITCARSLGRGVAACARLLGIGAIIALLIWGFGGLGAQQSSSLIAVEQQVRPGEIYYQGSGEPDRATVTLRLNALRDEPFPLDLVLVVDRSASSDVTTVRRIGREILGRLGGGEDRVALVSFADEATLDVELTANERLVEEGLDQLENMGKTALGEGLAEANRELLQNGRDDAVLAEILLVDGRSNAGRDPLPQAEIAGRNGIVIFAIGIGPYLREDILSKITGDTGGAFFDRYEEGVLDTLFSAIYRDLVGTEITVSETLAEGFSYQGSSANPPTLSTRGGRTVLTWQIEDLPVGGSWETSFDIGYATELPERETLDLFAEPGLISFRDFRHQEQTVELETLSLVVRGPNELPQADFTFSPESPTDLDTIAFDSSQSYDSDGQIVAWLWDFGDETTSTEQNPTHRYADNGRYTVKLTVWDDEGGEGSKSMEIEVLNVGPEASFTPTPPEPGIGQRVEFDASGSHDPDGEIVKYEWDLDGDGTFETEGPTAETVYQQAGTYRVALQVTDDDGASATSTQEVEVFEPAAVSREINTYLHVDKTLPGETFRVTVTIEAKMDLFGLGLDESLPQGWTVTPVENAGATYHQGAVQWLFVDKIPAGTTKTIIYDVTVPSDAELDIYDIKGNISSASPGFELAVGGENQVEITDRLPISWVVSRWDTKSDQFNIQLDDLITFDQIQQAVAWWLLGQTIANTGDAVIDLRTMEELVAYWLTDTPVYEPLP